MEFEVARGFIAIVPLQEIPLINQTKSDKAFGPKINEKHDRNEPLYRFKVMAVGGPCPIEGQMVPAEVEVGDVISLTSSNRAIRQDFQDFGFVVDGTLYFIVGFSHVAIIWKSEHQEKIPNEN
jgi:co-chaperonin GroES (HSP10)